MQLTISLPAATAMELQRRAIAERRRPRDEAAIIIERVLAQQTTPKNQEALSR